MGDDLPDTRRKVAALKKLTAQRHMEELKAAVAQRSQASASSNASLSLGCLLQALAFLKGKQYDFRDADHNEWLWVSRHKPAQRTLSMAV